MFIEDALRAEHRRPLLLGRGVRWLVEKLQKIAQESKKIIKKAGKWKPKSSQNCSKGSPKGLRLSIKVFG